MTSRGGRRRRAVGTGLHRRETRSLPAPRVRGHRLARALPQGLSDFYDVVHRRRDVRAQFIGGAIDPETLRRVLTAAHAAASVGLTQPWDFVLIDDAPTREAFYAHVRTEADRFAATLTPDRGSSSPV